MTQNEQASDELTRLMKQVVAYQLREQDRETNARRRGNEFLKSSNELIHLFGKLCIAKSCFLDDALTDPPVRREVFPTMSHFYEDDGGKEIHIPDSDEVVEAEFLEEQKIFETGQMIFISQLTEELRNAIDVCEKHLKSFVDFLPEVRLRNYPNVETEITYEFEDIRVCNANQDRLNELVEQRTRYPRQFLTAHHLISSNLMNALDGIYPFFPRKISQGILEDSDKLRERLQLLAKPQNCFYLYECVDHFPDMKEFQRIHRIAYLEQLKIADHFGVLDGEMSPAMPEKTTLQGPMLTGMTVGDFKDRLGIQDTAWRGLRDQAGIERKNSKDNWLSLDQLRKLLDLCSKKAYRKEAADLFAELFPDG